MKLNKILITCAREKSGKREDLLDYFPLFCRHLLFGFPVFALSA